MSPDVIFLNLKQAVRNVLRQRRRAFFALVTISGGVIAYLLASGFIQWVLKDMREATIRSQLGHIQIVRPGFFEKGIADPYSHLLPANAGLYKDIAKTQGVRGVTPRLQFTGLISHEDSTISFSGEGVDPEKDAELSRSVQIVDGQPLSTQAPNGIIVGEGLAANLGVKTGDTVVLLTTTAQGSINAIECKVRGLFATITKSYDDAFIRTPLPIAQQLARVQGATSWVVLLEHTADTDAIISELRAKAPQAEYQMVAWYELADFYNKTSVLFSRQVGLVRVLIAIIIILSIANTLSMSVIERTGEIGTIMALGVRQRQVMSLFLLEGVILGLFGGGLGVALGYIFSLIISAIGIPMPPPPGMARGYIGQIQISPQLAMEALVLAVVTTLVASIMPARKASKMIIVNALRHQR
jgi:putative ABC transport system permease protein